MKYNETLFNHLWKYVDWAKMEWCLLIYNPINQKMFAYDFEEKKVRSISYVIQCILDNGMLHECFAQDELFSLETVIPKRFKLEIREYFNER